MEDDIFGDTSFLDEEADLVEDWPKELQNLVDMGIVSVVYDKDNKPHFSLTELGRSVRKEIDLNLN